MNIKKHLNFSSLRSFLSSIFRNIQDPRQKGKVKHSLHDTAMSAFACMYFQDKSFLQFKKRVVEMVHPENLKRMFDIQTIPETTQIRTVLDNINSESLRPVFKEVFSRLQRGKYLEQYQVLQGLYYAPMDATEYFSSKKIKCAGCLTCEHTNGDVTCSHKTLQVAIMHPSMSQVIPLMPEAIHNSDGNLKQDCEMNAAKRLIPKLRQEHPKLGLIIGGDALFSKQPIIEVVLHNHMHYFFVAKPDDHEYLMTYLDIARAIQGAVHSMSVVQKDGKIHKYEWANDVPLNKRSDGIRVNYLSLTIISIQKDGSEKITFRSSWVTDLKIDQTNVELLSKVGRSRWKVENECFNTLKNQGYEAEHNYGHGENHLAFNIYLLTLIAFLFHQVFELTDRLYQVCRKKFGSKTHLWETLRTYVKILVFDTWELLLDFALDPIKYGLKMSYIPNP
jgi:DDE_Tnp_1-associated